MRAETYRDSLQLAGKNKLLLLTSLDGHCTIWTELTIYKKPIEKIKWRESRPKKPQQCIKKQRGTKCNF